jgi:hypothetical protein
LSAFIIAFTAWVGSPRLGLELIHTPRKKTGALLRQSFSSVETCCKWRETNQSGPMLTLLGLISLTCTTNSMQENYGVELAVYGSQSLANTEFTTFDDLDQELPLQSTHSNCIIAGMQCITAGIWPNGVRVPGQGHALTAAVCAVQYSLHMCILSSCCFRSVPCWVGSFESSTCSRRLCRTPALHSPTRRSRPPAPSSGHRGT